MKKIVSLIFAVLLCLSAFAGCTKNNDGDESSNTSAVSGWDYIKSKGKLIVGLDDTFAPMGYRDTKGTLVGFDIDLATEVGKLLGVEIEFRPIDWTAKEIELSSKRIDCIWNGMSATPGRIKSMALTNKYLNNKIIIATDDASLKISSGTELANVKIGTQADSSALEMMMADPAYESFKANVTEYSTYDEAIMDLWAGRIDCVAIDQVLLNFKNNNLEEKLSILDYDFGNDFYAIGCRKEEPDVAAKITEAIAAIIENGSGETISNKWFGKNLLISIGYDN